MKKLKRLKLHSAVVLQEKEMKAVQGGVSTGCHELDLRCSGTCVKEGLPGICDRLDELGGLCGCLIMYDTGGYGAQCEYGYWYWYHYP